MRYMEATVFFNGQFWIALVQRTDEDGTRALGKFVFGPEPSNTDLLDFYLTKLSDVELLPDGQEDKPIRNKPFQAGERAIKKSYIEFKALQKKRLSERKTERRFAERRDEEERYLEKREKRKKKRRGH